LYTDFIRPGHWNESVVERPSLPRWMLQLSDFFFIFLHVFGLMGIGLEGHEFVPKGGRYGRG